MQLLKPENKKSSILPLLAVGTFSLHLFTLLLLIFHGALLQDLSRQMTPQSLVQLVDGNAIIADAKPSFERYPETIRRFVGETMTLMLNWSEQQLPNTIWEISSQLLSNDLKPKFKSEITSLTATTQLENINRGTEYVLVIQQISQPIPIGQGKWKVEMLANHLAFSSSNSLGTSTTFNKQILVRAIDQQATSLPDAAPLPWHRAAYRLGEAKLEIYNICEITDKNCS
ncbi:hypothetical protein [Halotia branconii]|uniref:Uncharacterized protein n=1 Tax=Halotia branconii CENA392 TaxID=1539056 RepID=A0AAJ6NVE9_9CYAN|nr:hypothetical protein [Halotia branconii]WGV27448.1 hypothetical protein QI031_08170 [Halotia branconii CENA392]